MKNINETLIKYVNEIGNKKSFGKPVIRIPNQLIKIR